jgi:hypothetical protein
MEKLNYSVTIKAPKEKVWGVLFDNETYRKWTSVFAPGSYAETDWKEGSKALFLDGKGNGMVSRIAESRPHDYLAIKHLGIVKDGIENTDPAVTKGWGDSIESYALSGENGVTELKIELDSVEEFKDYFEAIWPKALDKVKELSERS